jgi:hypothetical protein
MVSDEMRAAVYRVLLASPEPMTYAQLNERVKAKDTEADAAARKVIRSLAGVGWVHRNRSGFAATDLGREGMAEHLAELDDDDATEERRRKLGTGALVWKVRRAALAQELVKRYNDGESLRTLAASTGRSYGFIHRILTEQPDFRLRTRGGARWGKRNRARTP